MEPYLDSVNNLWNTIQRNHQTPEMYSMIRDLIWGIYGGVGISDPTEVRDYRNMYQVAREDPDTDEDWDPWMPPLISASLQDLDMLYWGYLRGGNADQSKNSRNNDGLASETHVISGAIWIDRQRAMVVQMQQALVDVTRTHQETFYNRQHHQRLWDATRSLKDVSDFLINGTS